VTAKLYYIHDPMCSWCWGFRPTWLKLRASLPADVAVENVLGGLAPDNDQPMPTGLRAAIQGHWRAIETRLGTPFNHAFWTDCQPRRDTYKACRAVVAASLRDREEDMIEAIQQAYYLRALNPSEPETLVRLAGEIGLDQAWFGDILFSAETEAEFGRQLRLAQALGASSFPSLRLEAGGRVQPIQHDYQDHRISLEEIERAQKKPRITPG
jgi:putative protein-disulfide isomerase